MHHTHDFDREAILQAQTAADSIPVWREYVRQGLVDDADRTCADSVKRIEISAIDKRDTDGSEVSGHDVVRLDFGFLISSIAVYAQRRDRPPVELTGNGAE